MEQELFGSNPASQESANDGFELDQDDSILGGDPGQTELTQPPEDPEPDPNQQQPAPQEDAGGQSAPAEGEQGQPQGDPGGQVEMPEKFNSIDDVKRSLANIGEKLGKTPNWQELDTPQKIIRAYEVAEKELGATSNPDDYLSLNEERQRRQLLEQQNQILQNYVQQQYAQPQTQTIPNQATPGQQATGVSSYMQPNYSASMYQAQQQTPTAQPYTNQYGQYPPQANNTGAQAPVQQGVLQPGQPAMTGMTAQAGQAQQAAETQPIEISDEEWQNIFDSDKGPEVVGKLAAQHAERIADQKIQQTVQELEQREQAREYQRHQEAQQRRQELQRRRQERQYYANEIKRLQDTYGDEFETYRQQTAQVLQQKPWLAQVPGGLDMAFKEARLFGPSQGQRQTGGQPQAQQQAPQQQPQAQQPANQQSPQQQVQAQKQAARMPQSSGRGLPNQQKTREDQIVDSIFGEEPSGGIFG